MTFTYDGTLDTDLEKVRLEIGDITTASALFTDEEINYKLSANANNILKTAADLCDMLAARYARQVNFSMDGQSVSLSDKARMYREMAKSLRERSSAGLTTIVTTKIDGNSDRYDTPPDATSRERRGASNRDFEVGRWD